MNSTTIRSATVANFTRESVDHLFDQLIKIGWRVVRIESEIRRRRRRKLNFIGDEALVTLSVVVILLTEI